MDVKILKEILSAKSIQTCKYKYTCTSIQVYITTERIYQKCKTDLIFKT